MNRLCAGVVLAGLMIAGGARADGDIYVWGAGNNQSCGDWVTQRRDDPNSMTIVIIISWVQGYVTGLNAFMPTNVLPANISNSRHVGSHTDIPALSVWIDNYCQKHPLDTLQRAATVFYGYALAQGK